MDYKICRRKVKFRDIETAAAFMFENNITTIASWATENLFDGELLFLVVAVPNDAAELFNQQNYFKR